MSSPSFMPSSPSFIPSSPSFTPSSPSAPQHPHAASTTAFNNTNAAVTQTTQQSDTTPASTDPTQRSTGLTSQPMNENWIPTDRGSKVKAEMDKRHADTLQYYEDRRTGKIEERLFEDWRDDMDRKTAKRLYVMEQRKVKQVFFDVDYDNGFTGRGVSPEAMERPCLFGPRNETIDQRVDQFGIPKNEQTERSFWQASDSGSDVREDVGPLGGSRDDEEVGTLGAPTDEDDSRHHGHNGGEQEEQEVAVAEDMNGLMHLTARAVGVLMSGAPANTGDVSSPRTATIVSTESQTQLISSSPPTTWIPSTLPRKRARDAEEDTRDDDSSAQQKRRRMDDILGITRKDANTARGTQSVGTCMTPDIQQSRKRSRSSDYEDDATMPSQKRQRLYQRIMEGHDAERRYVADEHAEVDTSGQPILAWSSEVRIAAIANLAREGSSMGAGLFVDEELGEREDAFAVDEAFSTRPDWNTAHGINSDGASIGVPGSDVTDITGRKMHLYLPNTRGIPDKPWTEEEKEDLRSYVQDYGVEDWALLSESMRRPVSELQLTYVEVVAKRNLQAGRHELAGIHFPKG